MAEPQLPSPSTLAEVLNRNGYRLRPVLKGQTRKKLPQTDEIFSNVAAYDQAADDDGDVLRVSVDD